MLVFTDKDNIKSEIIINPKGLTDQQVAKRLENLIKSTYSVETNKDTLLINNTKLYNVYTFLLLKAKEANIKNPVIIINFKDDKINLILHTAKKGDKSCVLTEGDLVQFYDASSIMRNLIIAKQIFWKQ